MLKVIRGKIACPRASNSICSLRTPTLLLILGEKKKRKKKKKKKGPTPKPKTKKKPQKHRKPPSKDKKKTNKKTNKQKKTSRPLPSTPHNIPYNCPISIPSTQSLGFAAPTIPIIRYPRVHAHPSNFYTLPHIHTLTRTRRHALYHNLHYHLPSE